MQLPLPQVLASHLDRATVQSPKRVFSTLGVPSGGGGDAGSRQGMGQKSVYTPNSRIQKHANKNRWFIF